MLATSLLGIAQLATATPPGTAPVPAVSNSSTAIIADATKCQAFADIKKAAFKQGLSVKQGINSNRWTVTGVSVDGIELIIPNLKGTVIDASQKAAALIEAIVDATGHVELGPMDAAYCVYPLTIPATMADNNDGVPAALFVQIKNPDVVQSLFSFADNVNLNIGR